MPRKKQTSGSPKRIKFDLPADAAAKVRHALQQEGETVTVDLDERTALMLAQAMAQGLVSGAFLIAPIAAAERGED